MSTHIPAPAKPDLLEPLLESTPARLAVWRAGCRPLTSDWLQFRADHAMARDAVHSELSPAFLEFAKSRGFPVIQTMAESRHDFVLFPPKGKRTDAETLGRLQTLCLSNQDVQIVISDGLSASAVEANVPDLLPMLEQALKTAGITYGLPVVARYGRVAIADQLGHALNAKLAVNLIGERPGLSSATSLSAYLTYNPGPNTISSDRTVVSNIHSRGTPAVEAGAYVATLCRKILNLKVSGVRLQQMS